MKQKYYNIFTLQLLVLAIGLVACPGFAQQYQINTYNLDEGLANGLIKSVVTDDVGFVWSATDRGVIRFDGRKSILFKNEIPKGFAKAFCKRKNGDFLVLHDFGVTSILSKPDTTIFTNLIAGNSNDTDSTLYYPKVIYEDRNGIIWISENQSVVKYVNGHFTKYRFGSRDYADSFYKGFLFQEDENGMVWAISFNGNLYRYNNQKDTFEAIPNDSEIIEVGSFTYLGQGRFWVGAADGFFEIQLEDNYALAYCKKTEGPGNVLCSLLLPNQEFYIGTSNNGLFMTDLSNQVKGFSQVEILPFQDITSLFYDKNGIWVSGSESIALLNPVFFERPANSGNSHFSSLSFSLDSTIFATVNKYIFEIKKNGNEWRQYEYMQNDSIYPMAIGQTKDFLWVGDFSGELFKYYDSEKRLEKIMEINPGSQLTQILSTKQGDTWVAGHSQQGLIKIDKEGKIKYFTKGGLANTRVIKQTNTGVVYCAGGGNTSYLQLYLPTINRFKDMSVELGFDTGDNFYIEDMAFDESGEIYLASTHGLLKYSIKPGGMDGQRIKRIDLQKVPIDEPIKALAYSEGILWAATSAGLLMYQNNSSLFFDKSRGLPSKNISDRGLLIDKENTLWIATAHGLAYLSHRGPGKVITPKPIFQSIKMNGEKIADLNSQLSFEHNSYLEAKFVSLSYPANRIKYQYRLSELDSTWSNLISGNQLFLPKLAPGSYTLEIRAQQYGGLLWSESNMYQFHILSPWYIKWWAYLLYVASGLIILIGSVRIHNWNLVKKNERLELIIQNRTREINLQKNEIITQKNLIIQHNERYLRLKEKQLYDKIEYKNKQLTTHTLNIIQKNETLRELSKGINTIIRTSKRDPSSSLRQLLGLINYSFRKDKDWQEFKLYFEEVHTGFFENLLFKQPDLTPLELRHCALVRLNLSISETATLLGISPESVKTARFRLRKKLNLDTQQDLIDHVMAN